MGIGEKRFLEKSSYEELRGYMEQGEVRFNGEQPWPLPVDDQALTLLDELHSLGRIESVDLNEWAAGPATIYDAKVSYTNGGPETEEVYFRAVVSQLD